MVRRIVQVAVCGLAALLLSGGSTLAAVVSADPIPEPAGLGMLALGIAGVAWFKFRRK